MVLQRIPHFSKPLTLRHNEVFWLPAYLPRDRIHTGDPCLSSKETIPALPQTGATIYLLIYIITHCYDTSFSSPNRKKIHRFPPLQATITR
jgi:hypothetical protein